jgi:hypothetical protein
MRTVVSKIEAICTLLGTPALSKAALPYLTDLAMNVAGEYEALDSSHQALMRRLAEQEATIQKQREEASRSAAELMREITYLRREANKQGKLRDELENKLYRRNLIASYWRKNGFMEELISCLTNMNVTVDELRDDLALFFSEKKVLEILNATDTFLVHRTLLAMDDPS